MPMLMIVTAQVTKEITQGKTTGIWQEIWVTISQFLPFGSSSKETYNKLKFKKNYAEVRISDQAPELNQFSIDLLTDFTPEVVETSYYTLLTLVLNMGAFKAIIDIIVAFLTGHFIYLSYSTFVSRHIQRDL